MQSSTPKVWLADLDEMTVALAHIDAERGALALDERAALSGQRALTRVLLRLLLRSEGLIARIDAPLSRAASGRPMLAGAAADGADFSVSHSRSHALIAISRSGQCGVDIEAERELRMSARRLGLVTASGLTLALNGAEVPETARALTAWTCLEAFAKACGRGIGAVLTEVGVTAEGARTLEPADASKLAREMASRDGLAVAVLDMPVGLSGAIAAESGMLGAAPLVTRLTADDVRRAHQA